MSAETNRPSHGGPYKIGQRFGPYILEAYLGRGAFKSVYRACRDDGSADVPEVVAIGFPHFQDEDGIAELSKELAIASRLEHRNIRRVFGLERHDGVAFLVMEYVEGMSLRQRLKAEGSLPQDKALRLVGLVGEALAYAHGVKIIHRDVKPENIFLTTGEVPKLLDFGVGRVLTTTRQVVSTQIGTIEYMAPEQMRGATGTNADLWGLGVTFYEMLTGGRPFAGEMGEVIQQIMADRYDEKPLFGKGVDRVVVRVIRKMLNKDPQQRYQTAEELIDDLEAVARRTRLVDDDESRLEVLIRARVPLVCVLSYEEQRILDAVRAIAQRLSEERRTPRRLYIWSASMGLRNEQGELVRPDSVEDPTTALDHVISNEEDALYVFLDMHRHYSPVTTRLVRDAARAVRITRKSLLLVSPFFQVPEELQKEVALSVFQLPDRPLLQQVLTRVEEEARLAQMTVDLEPADRAAVVRAAAGLTAAEAELALRSALIADSGLSAATARRVVEAKTQVIRKTGILEYYHNPESFHDVGGLSRLLEWFRTRHLAFAETARYAGIPLPKGVLLLGVPGCGKSLCARALAGSWGVPLLRLDVGRIFGSYVGQSEANLRLAVQTAEAVSPCILWIDEVEKGFAGVRGQSGGGVAARVFGSFLNWLQDKRSPVFVVATANDLSGIPPEFLRQGRFDDMFFVGLPAEKERQMILAIHLTKRKRDPQAFDLSELAKATEGFNGAELEQVVAGGLFAAFDVGRELQMSDLLAAAAETRPLSRSRAREIAAMTTWAQGHAKMAS